MVRTSDAQYKTVYTYTDSEIVQMYSSKTSQPSG